MENNYKDIIDLYNDVEFYNCEFKNYDDDFTFWNYWIDKIKPNSVLEIGLGNGRITNLLSGKVNRYDVIEISKKLIEAYNQKHNLSNGYIYNQDMKNISINSIYNLVIIPFNTFSYLYTQKDINDFFDGIKKVTDQNSIIIIDIFNPLKDDLNDVTEYQYIKTFEFKNKKCELYEKHLYDIKNSIIEYYKKYKIGNNIKISKLPNKVFFAKEIDSIIKSNNFQILKKFGDYNNELYTIKSRKQILFIRRET